MSEILPKKESNITQEEYAPPSQDLQMEQISALVLNRTQALEQLKPILSKKLYFTLEEKLLAEQRELEKLLGFQQGREETLSHYTFILDSQYFDQIFLN